MNDHRGYDEHPGDEALRQRLRMLPAHRPPPHDGWARLQAALPPRATPGVASPAHDAARPRRAAQRRPRWAWPLGGALAAGLALYALLPASRLAQVPQVAPTLLQQQASAMDEEYRQAMAALPQAGAVDYQPALAELDDSVVRIRHALAQDPRSRHLLEQLQRTQSLRLELTRQAAMAATGLTT